MLAKRVIPCLDVRDGRVVKGVRFQDLRDMGDPADLAARYDEEGADEVVFLDITASREGRGTLLAAVERAARRLTIPLTVGGGIRTVEDIRQLLAAGADKVSINTRAVEYPDIVGEGVARFGSQCIVVAIDVRREPSGDVQVYTHGGTRPTGISLWTWLPRAVSLGAGEILLTSMDTDGTQGGYDLDTTRRAATSIPVPLIASGGAGHPEDLLRVLQEGQADAALAATIFHEGRYRVRDVKAYLAERGVPVRW